MRKAVLILSMYFALLGLATVLTQSAQSGSTHPTCWGCATPQEKAQAQKAIVKAFGRGYEGRTALRVAKCESGFNPHAANRRDSNGGSYGLFQINGIWGPSGYASWSWVQKMAIPRHNIDMALRVRATRTGWNHWTCY